MISIRTPSLPTVVPGSGSLAGARPWIGAVATLVQAVTAEPRTSVATR